MKYIGSPNIIIFALFSKCLKAWTRSSDPDAPERAEAILNVLEDDYMGSRKLTINPFSYLAVMNL